MGLYIDIRNKLGLTGKNSADVRKEIDNKAAAVAKVDEYFADKISELSKFGDVMSVRSKDALLDCEEKLGYYKLTKSCEYIGYDFEYGETYYKGSGYSGTIDSSGNVNLSPNGDIYTGTKSKRATRTYTDYMYIKVVPHSKFESVAAKERECRKDYTEYYDIKCGKPVTMPNLAPSILYNILTLIASLAIIVFLVFTPNMFTGAMSAHPMTWFITVGILPDIPLVSEGWVADIALYKLIPCYGDLSVPQWAVFVFFGSGLVLAAIAYIINTVLFKKYDVKKFYAQKILMIYICVVSTTFGITLFYNFGGIFDWICNYISSVPIFYILVFITVILFAGCSLLRIAALIMSLIILADSFVRIFSNQPYKVISANPRARLALAARDGINAMGKLMTEIRQYNINISAYCNDNHTISFATDKKLCK